MADCHFTDLFKAPESILFKFGFLLVYILTVTRIIKCWQWGISPRIRDISFDLSDKLSLKALKSVLAMAVQRLLSLGIIASLALTVIAGQIPVIDGVIGGVPSPSRSQLDGSAAKPKTSGTPVAGKMRYVENSGVCGTHYLLYIFHYAEGKSKKRRLVFIKLQDMQI